MANWKIDEIDFFDLYSCFPSMVELGRDALDISKNISAPLTVTGGLPFFGGAGNNYVTHSIATMMENLGKIMIAKVYALQMDGMQQNME